MSNTAVILLNYNTWEETIDEIKLLKSVKGIQGSDIIVVDNFSTNDSYQQLQMRSNEFGYQIYSTGENGGYAKGNNFGIKIAETQGYRFAWILNNDIVFEDNNILVEMETILNEDSKVAVVNPDVYSPEGYLYNRDSVKPSFFDMTFGLLFYKKKGRKLKDVGGYGYVYRPQGCCMLLDIQRLSEVDYLDENTFLYFEEFILAERLANSKYLCACANHISVVHNHSKTVKKTIQKKRIVNIQNNSFKHYLTIYRGFSRFEIVICLWFNTIKSYVLG